MTLMTEQTAVKPSLPTMSRRRVLVSAAAVSPIRGSEPGIGWNIGSRLAKYHDVTLMCLPGSFDPHRDEIEAYLKQHPIDGLTMLYVDSPWLHRTLDCQRAAWLRPFHYVGYAAWQRAALRKVREIHAKMPFEATHHLNILGYREPGYLWKLPIPFFWGPVAGASNLPWKYMPLLSRKDKLAYGLRNIANQLQKKIGRRPRAAARAAAHVWAIGPDNQAMFADWGVPAEMLCEAGGKPLPHLATIKTYDPSSEPLRLVWAGVHVGRKAVPLAMMALAKFDFPVHLTILGSGPETAKWKSIADSLGVADRIRWRPNMPQAEAHQLMAEAHVFVFPSLQEASSTVTLEALSLGLPVITHDACGMGFIVTPQSGYKVPMTSPQASADGIAMALRDLHDHPEKLSELSRGALQRSQELSWDYAAQEIAKGFDRVLSAKDRRDA